jgi:hypothetical protein
MCPLHSYGQHFLVDGQEADRQSTIDHCYTAGLKATVEVLPDSTTDHHPLLLRVKPARISGCNKATAIIKRRNLKALRTGDLEHALQSSWDWDKVHQIRDVERIHEYIVAGITTALDIAAPIREMRVKPGSNLYLSGETLAVIKARDRARRENGSNSNYRNLRNEATRLVRRDKIRSNIKKLGSAGDVKVLWELANEVLGKSRPTLPSSLTRDDGTKTVGDKAAADLMNE